ncbi:unnamed protein product [Clavelina lepadiformis]|uniref:SHSP domain-containing protein n=1 Tax=Clavelina lepadiformis TaxID=159417 RepID=A0ABP0FM43_CLALP
MELVPRDSYFGRPSRYTGFPDRYSLWPAYGNRLLEPQWPVWNQNHSNWFLESRRRFMEMERKFEHFMRKVDDRFTGMLGLLDVDEDPSLPIDVEHEGKKENSKAKNKFCINVNVQDFKPEEVTVKVSGGKALVQAKRESKNEDKGMYAYTFREFKRAFTLPENMKTEDVTSSLSEDGILKIEGVRDVKPAITDVPILVEHSSLD